MIEALILSCATAGFLIALYFTLVQYRVIPPDTRWIPEFCRIDGATCLRLLATPDAKVFGIPNSLVGLIYYVSILVLPIPIFETVFLVASIFAVGLGMYLTHSLLVKLKTHCALCYVAHLINLAIANLLIIRAYQLRFG